MKKAHQQLQDSQQKEICQSIIENAEKEVKKSRRKRIKEGTPEDQLDDYNHELLIATRKHFADHELRKRKFGRIIQEHSVRISLSSCNLSVCTLLALLYADCGTREGRGRKREEGS